MKCPLVAIRPNVELEAFKFNTLFIGDVIKDQSSKIRLPGLRTKASKLWNLHMDMVIPCRGWVWEGFQIFCGAARHSLLSVKSVRMIIPRVVL
jgi:hypothetical protein